MSKIKVKEIFGKHLSSFKWPQPQLVDAIKEIVEKAIDMAAEEGSAQLFGSSATKVYKSILDIKKEIDYE